MKQKRNFFIRLKQIFLPVKKNSTTWIITKELKGSRKEKAIREIATRKLYGALNPKKSYIINIKLNHEFLIINANAHYVVETIVQEIKGYSEARISIDEIDMFPAFCTSAIPKKNIISFSILTK